jgi:hypothetical protein
MEIWQRNVFVQSRRGYPDLWEAECGLGHWLGMIKGHACGLPFRGT